MPGNGRLSLRSTYKYHRGRWCEPRARVAFRPVIDIISRYALVIHARVLFRRAANELCELAVTARGGLSLSPAYK